MRGGRGARRAFKEGYFKDNSLLTNWVHRNAFQLEAGKHTAHVENVQSSHEADTQSA